MKILYYKMRAVAVTWLLRLMPRQAPMIFKGANSSLALCEQVAVLGYQKVLIVTDNFLFTSGLLDNIISTLEASNVRFAVYDGVLPDPTFDQVQAAEKKLRDENCEAIIAIGGGSVLDAAKMTAMLRTNPGDLASFTGIRPSKNAGTPLFAIPTTAGTGSEITLAAVITDPISHMKMPIGDGKLLPRYIALDAELMRTMPPSITAATGMDALTHAVESYLSKASHQASEEHAFAAIKLVFNYLLCAFKNGDDLVARDAMAQASFYAGAAFDKTSVGYVHGIAHQLGRLCGTPHGNANAMVLPEVLLAYGDCVHSKLAKLAELVGIAPTDQTDAQLAQQFIQAVIDMRKQMDLPLKPQGLKESHIADVVKEALAEAGSLYPVPRYMSKKEIADLVRPLLA